MSAKAVAAPVLSEAERRRIVASHRDSLAQYGHAPQALYWSSEAAQTERFRALAGVGIRPGDSLLDVGCGFADLMGWLQQQGCPVRYTGIDLSPDLLEVAAASHPDAELLCGELSDFTLADASFDWVVLSGALNDPVDEDGDYAYATIAGMYRLCRKGIAFNLLDATEGVTFLTLGLQHFDPEVVVAFCRRLIPHVELVRGYLEGDFTLRLWRDAKGMAENGRA